MQDKITNLGVIVVTVTCSNYHISYCGLSNFKQVKKGFTFDEMPLLSADM